MLRIGFTVAVLGLPGPVRADDPSPIVGAAVAQVGVVDPAGKPLYLPARTGGLEAVELATGKVLAAHGLKPTDEPVKPAGPDPKPGGLEIRLSETIPFEGAPGWRSVRKVSAWKDGNRVWEREIIGEFRPPPPPSAPPRPGKPE
ncbi:MAG: hypothetical protein JWO38_788 [Gemmataceae bacterium]|nr:hypothetical protein [Gemmataceae bacterium]